MTKQHFRRGRPPLFKRGVARVSISLSERDYHQLIALAEARASSPSEVVTYMLSEFEVEEQEFDADDVAVVL